ncbi:hypothetical protein [Flavobacterium davisii]|uniref:Uncharacterized protein n=1 Tax=Flavobacterium columnare TaxID=996 RepID=A0A8G0P5Y0_9FLAO|nr:hypothetical protein [Flavobacterium davisii]QYS89491.1 hypothetical protein JJC05_04215 [Flavobacterium davisii]
MSLITRFLQFLKKRVISNFNKDIITFILSMEGAIMHLDALNISESEKILKDTKKIISKFEVLSEKMSSKNFYDNTELKDNFKYMLKCLYKIESKLHKKVYQSVAVIKTDEELKKGVVKMNSSNIHNLLSC